MERKTTNEESGKGGDEETRHARGVAERSDERTDMRPGGLQILIGIVRDDGFIGRIQLLFVL